MSGRREVDRGANKYVLNYLGSLPVFRLLLGIGFLMIWTFTFGLLVDEVTATSDAAKGEGVPGTFIAESETCGRGGCSWYGTFTTGSIFQVTLKGVELRGTAAIPPMWGRSFPHST